MKPTFDGQTYDEKRDKVRLSTQLGRVLDVMKRGHWYTLQELSQRTLSPESSVSARLRDLRKPRFGGYEIQRESVARGLFKYRLVTPTPTESKS